MPAEILVREVHKLWSVGEWDKHQNQVQVHYFVTILDRKKLLTIYFLGLR